MTPEEAVKNLYRLANRPCPCLECSPPPKPKRTYLINACHSITGGGLVYLKNILPYFVNQPGRWILAAQRETLDHLTAFGTCPEHLLGWEVWIAPRRGLSLHLWEQLVLPVKIAGAGVDVCLCNANYVPLLAPCKTVMIIHTDTSAERHFPLVARPQWRDEFMKALREVKR